MLKILQIFQPKGDFVVLSEKEAQKKIDKWREILVVQAKTIEKLKKGLDQGTSWLTTLPTRIETTSQEISGLKEDLQKASTENTLLLIGKKVISKEKLLQQLNVTSGSMKHSLRTVDLEYNRLQDKAVELATKIQESEIYVSLSGSLSIARSFIDEVEKPIKNDSIEVAAAFKTLTFDINSQNEITDEEVEKKFRKEFNRVRRSREEVGPNPKVVRKARVSKTNARTTVRK